MPAIAIVLAFVSGALEGNARALQWALAKKKTVNHLVTVGIVCLLTGLAIEIIGGYFETLGPVKDILEAIFGIGFLGLGAGCLFAALNLWATPPGQELSLWLQFGAPSQSIVEILIEMYRLIRGKKE